MPTSYTTLLGLALPVTGELSGTWGDVVSNYITQYLDSAVAGTQTISGSQTAVTLSVTNGSSLVTAGSGATGSAQFQIINCTGNPAGLLTITAPASSRQYIIINSTSTSQSVKIVGTGPTTGVTLIAGEKAHVAWNGSDFVKIATTAAAGGSNTQVQYNSSGVLAGSSNMTFDGTNLTVGGTASATKLIPTGGAITGNGMYLPAANSVAITTNGAQAIYIDSSQNVGVGTSSLTARFESQKDSAATSPASDQSFPAWTSGAVLKNLSATNGAYSALSLLAANTAGTTQGYSIASQSTSSGYASNLLFIARTAAGTGTVNATLDASGNLLIGLTSGGSYKLDVSGSANQVGRFTTSAAGSYGALHIVNTGTNAEASIGFRDSSDSDATSWVIGKSIGATDAFGFYYGGNRMLLDTSGNLGIGTTSPQYRISLGNTTGRKLAVYDDGSSGGTASGFGVDLSGSSYELSSWVGSPGGGNGVFTWGQVNTTTNAYTERVRITSGGDFCVGTTAKVYEGVISVSFDGGGGAGDQGIALIDTNATLNGDYAIFINSAGNVAGKITHNGTTTVAYTTSSDHRLKEDIAPMTGALAKVAALKPVIYKWKADGSDGEGFIAHEIAEVCPSAVVGEKDAVDADGKPVYQGIDTSFLVATLTAAIQEQQALIQSLTARIAALESKGV